MATLTAADYAVIGVLILISSLIGVYYWLIGGRQKTTEVIKSHIPFRSFCVAICVAFSYLLLLHTTLYNTLIILILTFRLIY